MRRVPASGPRPTSSRRESLSRDGVVVVVRPDQYVAAILPLDAVDELAGFLDGRWLPAHAESPRMTRVMPRR